MNGLTAPKREDSIESIKEFLESRFGYQTKRNLSKDDLLSVVKSLEQSSINEQETRFLAFQHLADELIITEKMLTDSLYTSLQSFSTHHIKDKKTPDKRKKELYYQIRDIIISNYIKVIKPENLPKIDSPRKIVVKKKTAPAKAIEPYLNGKSLAINKIIDEMISKDEYTLEEIKPKHIMDRYSTEHNESISNGYTYSVLTKRKALTK